MFGNESSALISVMGTKVPPMELSFIGTKVPWYESSSYQLVSLLMDIQIYPHDNRHVHKVAS